MCVANCCYHDFPCVQEVEPDSSCPAPVTGFCSHSVSD